MKLSGRVLFLLMTACVGPTLAADDSTAPLLPVPKATVKVPSAKLSDPSLLKSTVAPTIPAVKPAASSTAAKPGAKLQVKTTVKPAAKPVAKPTGKPPIGKTPAGKVTKIGEPAHAGPIKLEVPNRAWIPEGSEPRAVLLCVHGLGLNSDSFQTFGQKMANKKVAVYAIDVRGFGKWAKDDKETRCNFEECLTDIKTALEALHSAYGHTPIYILGESMGGAIAMHATANYPALVDGMISCVPSGQRFHNKSTALAVGTRVVTGRSNKPMKIGEKIVDQATQDPEDNALAVEWADDPNNRMELTPNELRQFQKFMNENEDMAKKITDTPVLVVQGSEDKLVKPSGTIDLFNLINSKDKILLVVGGKEHLIFEYDQCPDPVVNMVLVWIKAQEDKD